jgi:hypothetical protein
MAQETSGPIMLAATTVLRGHKARIGKIVGDIALPRTVPVVNLVAGSIGVLLGLFIGALVQGTLQMTIYSGLIGGGIGVFLVTYSPLQGESMLKWIGLSIAAKRQEVKIDGQTVRVAIGVAYLSQPARGRVHILRGAVDINPEQFDERGVLVPAARRAARQLSSRELGRSRSVEYKPLPANEDTTHAARTSRRRRAPSPKPTRRHTAPTPVDARAAVPASTAGRPAVARDIHHVAAPPRSDESARALRRRGAGPQVPDQNADPFAGKPRRLPK